MFFKLICIALCFYVGILIFTPVNSQRADTTEDVTAQNTSTKVCYKDGKARMCLPKFESLAYKITPNVTSTCGLVGREKYCVQTSVQSSSYEGQYCDYCDETEAGKSHNAEKMTDFNKEKARDSFWQSQTLASTESKSSSFNVNITLDFGIQSQITYIWLRFQSPRPYSMAIYRRKTYDSDWEPWGYFSRNCLKQYGVPVNQKLVRANRTRPLCLSAFSDMVPLSDGNVRHVTLDKRLPLASGNWFWNDTQLQEWTLATEIRVSLDKLNTHGDTYSKDVLNRYFYAITDLSVGGRCHCNGHASVCKKDESGLLTKRRCLCQHNTEGEQCERCRSGFEDRPWRRATERNPWVCKPCNCSGNSHFCEFSWQLYAASGNVSGGRCINCQGNTQGPHCEQCLPNHRRSAPASNTCVPCLCHPSGSVTQQCDQAGNCTCRPLVAGAKCDRCQVGSYNLSATGCQSCGCQREGTVGNSGECDSGTGECRCKPNVAGARCDACRPGHFGLQPDDPDGCQRCFCYGHSDRCSLHTGLVRTELRAAISPNSPPELSFGFLLRGSAADTQHKSASSAVQLFPDAHIDAALVDMPPQFDSLFFTLPPALAGNQSLSYNRRLRFTLRLARAPVTRSGVADLELASAEKIFSTSFNVSRLVKGENRLSVRLAHDPASTVWHQLSDSAQQFRSVLANLTSLRIRASFLAEDGSRVFAKLYNVTLESARLGDGPGAAATNVHVCKCPEGHAGSFCERCQPGFTRQIPGSGPFGKCVPCLCHGHWDICDPELGTCGSGSRGNDSRSARMCRDNTVGKNCELCAPGYYGNATLGPDACKKCPCPAGSPCVWDATLGQPVCTSCPPALAGSRCELCADNFWGAAPDCRPCSCSNNSDPNDLQACDRSTGRCTACVDNTAGWSCDSCKNGYYGNALAPGRAQCRPCDCHLLGSADGAACDNRTGECRCKPGVAGQQCDRCQTGFFNISGGAGCQPCGCNFTGTGARVSCHLATGQCACLTGVAGRACDTCRRGFFNFTSAGCTPCACDPVGTRGPLPAQCDAAGRCPCRQFVAGDKCDRCQENRFNLSAGCSECPACYGVVQQLANGLRDELADIERLFNESVGLDEGDVSERLRRLNATAAELLRRLRQSAGPSLQRTNLRLLRNLSRDLRGADAAIDSVILDLDRVANFTNVTFPSTAETLLELAASIEAEHNATKRVIDAAQLLQEQCKNASQQLRGANEALRSQMEKVKAAVDDLNAQVVDLSSRTASRSDAAEQLLNDTKSASDRVRRLEAEGRSLLQQVAEFESETAKAKLLVDNATARANSFHSRLLALRTNLSFVGPNLTQLQEALELLASRTGEVDRNYQRDRRSFDSAAANLRDAIVDTRAVLERQNRSQTQLRQFYDELLSSQREVNETLRRCRKYYEAANSLLLKLKNYDEEIKTSEKQVNATLEAAGMIGKMLAAADAQNNRSQELLASQEPIANQTLANMTEAGQLASRLQNKSNSLISDSRSSLAEVTDAHNRTQLLFDSLERLDAKLQQTMDRQERTDKELESLSAASSASLSRAADLQKKVQELSETIRSLGQASNGDAEFDAEVRQLNATIDWLVKSDPGGGDKDSEDLSSLLTTVEKYQKEQTEYRREIEWLEKERSRLTEVADELQLYTDDNCPFVLPSSIT